MKVIFGPTWMTCYIAWLLGHFSSGASKKKLTLILVGQFWCFSHFRLETVLRSVVFDVFFQYPSKVAFVLRTGWPSGPRRSYPIPSSEHAATQESGLLAWPDWYGRLFFAVLFFFYRDNLTGQLVNPPHARGGLSQNRRGGQNHSSLKRPQMTWFKLRTCHWIKVLKKKTFTGRNLRCDCDSQNKKQISEVICRPFQECVYSTRHDYRR